MEEYANNTPLVQEDNDGFQIDLMEILTKLLKQWKKIFIVCFIFGVLGIVSALNMKRFYTVSLTLAPELQNRGSSSLSSLASMLGGGAVQQLTGNTDAMNVMMFPEICKSTPFLATLLDVPLESYVSEKQKENGVKPMETTVYRHLSGEDKEKGAFSKWMESILGKGEKEPYTGVKDPTELTPAQARVVSALSQCILTNVDKKTGITTITVTLDDPRMAKQLADTVCFNLQAYVTDYRTRKAKADYEYYVTLADEAKENLVKAQAAYAASVDYDRSVILQSANSEKDRLRSEMTLANQIYSQMAQQREMARAKIQEEKPVYTVVQPAVLPRRPINSRAKRVLIWGFVGLILSLGWYGFGEDYLKKARVEIKEKLQEPADK